MHDSYVSFKRYRTKLLHRKGSPYSRDLMLVLAQSCYIVANNNLLISARQYYQVIDWKLKRMI